MKLYSSKQRNLDFFSKIFLNGGNELKSIIEEDIVHFIPGHTGTFASSYIHSGEKLFLDSGTTVMKLAEALVPQLQTKALTNLTVITNSFTLVELLASHCKVILTGGEPRLERRDMCRTLAEDNLGRFHVDKAFIGADTIHLDHGLMTTDERTAKMNEIVISNAAEIYVLADSSKFNQTSFISYATFDQVTQLITDSTLSEREVK